MLALTCCLLVMLTRLIHVQERLHRPLVVVGPVRVEQHPDLEVSRLDLRVVTRIAAAPPAAPRRPGERVGRRRPTGPSLSKVLLRGPQALEFWRGSSRRPRQFKRGTIGGSFVPVGGFSD